jgi:hypothetical protein
VFRFAVMSRLGLAEPLVRLARAAEKSNRTAAARAAAKPSPPLRLERTRERPA